MFHEIWQIERSFFYDPHYHGVDTVAEEAKYRPFLDEVGSRSDLSSSLSGDAGQFNHRPSAGSGGTIPHPGSCTRPVCFGADYEIVNGRYRIKRIYTCSERWNPQADAPLAQPGVKIAEGDFILAVGGQGLEWLE